MKTISVNIPQEPYPVYVGNGILDQFAVTLRKHTTSRQIVIITVEKIFELYGDLLLAEIDSDCRILVLHVPDGEKSKSLRQVEALYSELLEKKIERGAVLVAFGGGVIGDLAGFVAATYLRGIDFVQVPTTLLAQVDSSIGGKTGVNHRLGKNLIGAFKQPLFVFSDVHLLQSLPDAELRSGLGEVIKYGFILNKELFIYLLEGLTAAANKDEQVLLHLVESSVQEKAAVVARDEKEAGLRMILNFGHTFGHALEKAFSFEKLKHGEAVVLGMQCALIYNFKSAKMSEDEYTTGRSLLDKISIPIDKALLKRDQLMKNMLQDKKVKDACIRLVLVDEIGNCRIEQNTDEELILQTWETFIGEQK